MSNALMQALGCAHPIIKAPLAGGGDTPALVAAACEGGGVGILGAAYLSPAEIASAAREIRRLTSLPFGINLFAPTQAAEPEDASRALAHLAPHFKAMGLPPPSKVPTTPHHDFDDQFAAVLEGGPLVFSFAFGLLPAYAMAAAHNRSMFVMGTATTVEEALLLERAGVSAVVAQGSEAGGHRSTFAGDFSAALIGTIALVPQVADAVQIPVVASGGIMDGRGIAAALALGADAVQMGTAFLGCEEAGIPDAYRAVLMEATEDMTRLTTAFSGRPARGIANRFLIEMAQAEQSGEVLPFPWQNSLTRPLRTAAAERNCPDYLSLWAGQGLRLARRLPAAALIEQLVNELQLAVGPLQIST